MNRRNVLLRVSGIVLLFAGALACGGGGGGGGGIVIPNPLVATFTPAGCGGTDSVKLGAGSAAGDTFDVQILVSGLADFFGAGFGVQYDPATAMFLNSSTTGTFLTGNTIFDVELAGGAQGTVDVLATLSGSGAGITPVGDDLLITLSFRALVETAGNAFAVVTPRQVETCPTAGGACTSVPDGSVVWCGGMLTAAR